MDFRIIIRNKTMIVPVNHDILQSMTFREHVNKDNYLIIKKFPINMYEELFYRKDDIFQKSCYQICEYLYFLRYIGYQNICYMNDIYKCLGCKISSLKNFDCLSILKNYITELYLICPYILKFDINYDADEYFITKLREDVRNNYMRYIPIHEFEMEPYDTAKQFILMCKMGNYNIVEYLYNKYNIEKDVIEMGYYTSCKYGFDFIALFLAPYVSNLELGYSIAIEYNSDVIIHSFGSRFSNDYHNIALAHCAKCGNINIFLLLLGNKRFGDELINNCFRDAIFYNYTDICSAILNDNYRIDNSHILYACEHGRYNIIELLSKKCTDKNMYVEGMFKIIEYSHTNLLNLMFSIYEYDEIDIIKFICYSSNNQEMFSSLCRFYGMKYEDRICDLFKILDDTSAKTLFDICVNEFSMYKIELFQVACYIKDIDYIKKFCSKEKITYNNIKFLNSEVLKYVLENTNIIIPADDALLCIEGDIEMLKYLLYESRLVFDKLKILKYGYIYPKCHDVAFDFITK